MWCIPSLTPEFITKMEDVLDIYEREYDEKEPVLCFDEKPVQLLDETRSGSLPAPGKVSRRDYEYVRKGTANVFCCVEPKAGRHFTYVTKNRKAKEFAKVLKRIASIYSNAQTIHLVLDNLNIHCLKSLTDFYGEAEGLSIWNRFTVHFTPKHASWLDQAEIEIGIYSRQCLGKRRVSSIEQLRIITQKWNKEMNKRKVKIKWTFTSKKARSTFNY